MSDSDEQPFDFGALQPWNPVGVPEERMSPRSWKAHPWKYLVDAVALVSLVWGLLTVFAAFFLWRAGPICIVFTPEVSPFYLVLPVVLLALPVAWIGLRFPNATGRTSPVPAQPSVQTHRRRALHGLISWAYLFHCGFIIIVAPLIALATIGPFMSLSMFQRALEGVALSLPFVIVACLAGWWAKALFRRGRQWSTIFAILFGSGCFALLLVFMSTNNRTKFMAPMIGTLVCLVVCASAAVVVPAAFGMLRRRAWAEGWTKALACVFLVAVFIHGLLLYWTGVSNRSADPLWRPLCLNLVLGLWALAVIFAIELRGALNAATLRPLMLRQGAILGTFGLIAVGMGLHLAFGEARYEGKSTSAWLAELKSSDAEGRGKAVEALDGIGYPVLSGLEDVLQHSNPDVRDAGFDTIRAVMRRFNRNFMARNCSGGMISGRREAHRAAGKVLSILESVRTRQSGIARYRAAYLTLLVGGQNWKNPDETTLNRCIETLVEGIESDDRSLRRQTIETMLHDTLGFQRTLPDTPAAGAMLLVATAELNSTHSLRSCKYRRTWKDVGDSCAPVAEGRWRIEANKYLGFSVRSPDVSQYCGFAVYNMSFPAQVLFDRLDHPSFQVRESATGGLKLIGQLRLGDDDVRRKIGRELANHSIATR